MTSYRAWAAPKPGAALEAFEYDPGPLGADEVEITVEGDVWAEDIALAAGTLAPNLQEMLDIRPRWEDGMTGIMQLMVLLQIEESLKNRTR